MHDDTITINGREYRVFVEYDYAMGAPWDEHDGHGVVSEWTTRDKRPGELVLVSDRSGRRYYDFAETMRIAKREGWGCGNDARAELAAKLGRDPTPGELRQAAVMADFAYLQGWCDDDWHWCYVQVTAPDGEYDTVGGFSSDDDDGIMECARDIAGWLDDAYQDRQTEEATL